MKTFVRVSIIIWTLAFVGGLITGKSAFGQDCKYRQTIKLDDEGLPYRDKKYDYWTKTTREGNYFKIVQQQESIQSQNLVNIKNSKIEKLILFDEITNYLLTVDYENFKPLGKILFPGRHLFTSVSYSDDSGVPVITNINFNFKEVERTNRPLKFPFNIPSKYVLKKI